MAGVRVIDKDAQSESEVSAEEAERGWREGRYALPDSRVAVRRGHETGYVDASSLADVLGGGWSLVDEETKRSVDIQREESGVVAGTIGAAEAAASGLTFGLSRVAERGLGVDTERMRARDEALGGLGTAIEIGAGVAGSLVPAGALGKGAAGLAARALTAPTRGVARLGEATAAGLTRIAGTGATSTAGRVVQAALPIAGREAVEGFLYGIGADIDESVLGDREISSEHLLASGLMSGLLGGVGGVAMAGLARTAHGAQQIASSKMQKILTSAAGSEGSEAVAKTMARKVSDAYGFLGAGERERRSIENIIDTMSTPEGRSRVDVALNDVQGTQQEMAREVTGLLRERKALSDEVRVLTQGESKWKKQALSMPADAKIKAVPAGQDLLDDMQRKVQGLRQVNAESHSSSYIESELREFEARVIRAKNEIATAAGDPRETYRAIDMLKRDLGHRTYEKLGEAIKTGRLAESKAVQTYDALDDFYKGFQKHLEDQSLWGGAAVQQAEMNSAYSAFRALARDSDSSVASLVNGKKPVDANRVLGLVRKQGREIDGSTATELDKVLDAEIKHYETLKKYYDFDDATSKRIDDLVASRKKIGDTLAERSKIAAAADDISKWRGMEGGGSPSITMLSTGGPLAGAAVGGLLGGPVGSIVGGVIGQATRPYTMLRTISGIMSMIDRSKASMNGSVKAFLDGSRKAVSRVGAKTRHALPPAAGQAGAYINRDESPRQKRERIQKALVNYSNPSRAVASMEGHMRDVRRAAPLLTDVAQSKAAKAAAYLQQQMPIVYRPSPMTKEEIVSPSEEARFARIADVVEDPSIAIEHLADGTLTNEEAEALREVWPAIYNEVRSTVMEEMQRKLDDGEEIDYDARTQMWVMFDVISDDSQTPEAVQSAQSVHTAAAAQQQAQSQQTQQRRPDTKNVEIAKRMGTEQQWQSVPLGQRYS